jgi:hypothetical protein
MIHAVFRMIAVSGQGRGSTDGAGLLSLIYVYWALVGSSESVDQEPGGQSCCRVAANYDYFQRSILGNSLSSEVDQRSFARSLQLDCQVFEKF